MPQSRAPISPESKLLRTTAFHYVLLNLLGHVAMFTAFLRLKLRTCKPL